MASTIPCKMVETLQKISYNLCFFPRFQWNCIESYRFPPPPFQCWVCKIVQPILQAEHRSGGRGNRKKKDVWDWKQTFLIRTVSQLFLHGMVWKTRFEKICLKRHFSIFNNMIFCPTKGLLQKDWFDCEK